MVHDSSLRLVQGKNFACWLAPRAAQSAAHWAPPAFIVLIEEDELWKKVEDEEWVSMLSGLIRRSILTVPVGGPPFLQQFLPIQIRGAASLLDCHEPLCKRRALKPGLLKHGQASWARRHAVCRQSFLQPDKADRASPRSVPVLRAPATHGLQRLRMLEGGC